MCMYYYEQMCQYFNMKGIVKKQVILKLNYPTRSVVYTKPSSNILIFKRPEQVLSDSDIASMFMALVNLIKKNTILKYEIEYKNKTKYLVDKLNDCLVELQNKNKLIAKLNCDKARGIGRLLNKVKSKTN